MDHKRNFSLNRLYSVEEDLYEVGFCGIRTCPPTMIELIIVLYGVMESSSMTLDRNSLGSIKSITGASIWLTVQNIDMNSTLQRNLHEVVCTEYIDRQLSPLCRLYTTEQDIFEVLPWGKYIA